MSQEMYNRMIETGWWLSIILTLLGVVLVFYKTLRRSRAAGDTTNEEGAEGTLSEWFLPIVKAPPGLTMIFVGAALYAGLMFVAPAVGPAGFQQHGICAPLTYNRTSGADGDLPDTVKTFIGALNTILDAGQSGAPSREDVGLAIVNYLQRDGEMRGNLVSLIIREVSDPQHLEIYCEVEQGRIAIDSLTGSQELAYRRVEDLVTMVLAP